MSRPALSFVLECPARLEPVRRTSPTGRRLPLIPPAVLAAVLALASAPPALALSRESYVSGEKGAGRFALCAEGRAAPLHAGAEEYPGVLRALRDLQADLARVTKVRPALATGPAP